MLGFDVTLGEARVCLRLRHNQDWKALGGRDDELVELVFGGVRHLRLAQTDDFDALAAPTFRGTTT